VTILNYPNDGLPPEFIAIFRVIAHLRIADKKSVIDSCLYGPNTHKEAATRLRGALVRWTDLGLFKADADSIQVSDPFRQKRGESLDDLTARLPARCRSLILEERNCLPLWGEGVGIAADFVLGAAWILAQDIYQLPTSWTDIDPLQSQQTIAERKFVGNDVQWNGLRYWMRYLGFATGDSGSFQVDPTIAIKAELPSIFGTRSDLPAKEFITALSSRLPVLDYGQYRQAVEDVLNRAAWRPPAIGHLSMSLSLALRRLALDNVIRLEGRADTGTSFRLTGRNYRTWIGFESVRWMGESA
jgi:hypothetical protein